MSKKVNITIKKIDFVNKIQELLEETSSSNLKKSQIIDMYDATINAFSQFMMEAKEKKKKDSNCNLVVRLSKFGSFSVGLRPACEYSNPQTKEKVKKPESYRVRFLKF